MRAEKFHQFSGNWQAIKSLRTMSLGGLIVVLRNLPRSHWSQLWEWDLHSCRCFLIPWCGPFLSHGMIIHLGGENGGSVFLVVQSMVYSLEAEPGGHPVLCLCLQSAICNQNKFIFFINYIFSNFFMQWGKKKSSNPMPLVGTSLSTLQYPNVQHDSWHAARLQFLLSIDQRGSLD